jgi:hypothetical protein
MLCSWRNEDVCVLSSVNYRCGHTLASVTYDQVQRCPLLYPAKEHCAFTTMMVASTVSGRSG